ncbi:M48 metallopeptidase family protein [Arthrobacter sp. 35W]|uniref:M48 metallopeptidase family protein n=1 Tax=Arthrobacter sp. 35W TaxID=1132441 RepID=UPI00041A2A07|nr:M48 family metallopeptidase [Arthrobacter sp. 35W]
MTKAKSGPSDPAPASGAVPLRTASGAPVVVRRSARRKRTVSANWEGGTAVVAIPAHFTAAQELHWVERMLAKLEARTVRQAGPGRTAPGDDALMARAAALSQRYLGGRATPLSVRWVSNQRSRWGSCTPSRRTIRLSNQLQGMPEWVVDYVILHELAHLLVPSHSPAFWAELAGCPRQEEAKAFLNGVSYATSRGLDAGANAGTGMDDDVEE